jgi:quinol monooxygenase YgiN
MYLANYASTAFREVRVKLREVASSLCWKAKACREGGRMESTDRSYSSGEWDFRAGSEEEFVQRWTTFIEWSLENAPGAGSFVLVRSTEDPTKFLSLGSWESQEAQQEWREMPRMQELLGQCRDLCEEFG